MQISAFIITLVSFLTFCMPPFSRCTYFTYIYLVTTATFGSPVPVELAIASREPVADISAALDTVRSFDNVR
jgi:hypothetical protein